MEVDADDVTGAFLEKAAPGVPGRNPKFVGNVNVEAADSRSKTPNLDWELSELAVTTGRNVDDLRAGREPGEKKNRYVDVGVWAPEVDPDAGQPEEELPDTWIQQDPAHGSVLDFFQGGSVTPHDPEYNYPHPPSQTGGNLRQGEQELDLYEY